MLVSLRKFDKSEVAQQRMKIIKFYEKYGEKAAKEAFGADRKVISRWRKRLKENGGRLESLMPLSTRPHNLVKPRTPLGLIEFIQSLREKHPRLGKEKIKVLLDRYCLEEGLKTISEGTIGNIIKRHNFFFQKQERVYHNPASKWAQGEGRKKKRLRVKHPPKPADYGYILSDTVERLIDGVKYYFYSCLDAKLKFALTLVYKRLNSRNMRDFYFRFKTAYPKIIKDWQSDNGAENQGEFEEQLQKDKIPHYFSYPRCPKINTYIERYNRTVQEEFLDNHLDIIHDEKLFNQELADWLIFYNTQRPHKSLGLKSPIDYLISQGQMSQMSLTYTSSFCLLYYSLLWIQKF